MNNNIPFPQADDLGKIFKLIITFKAYSRERLKDDLELNSNRQIDYYYNASIWLGFLISKDKLSDLGEEVFSSNRNFQKEIFILRLLKNKLIKQIVFNYDNKEIETILKQFDEFSSLSRATKDRRITTIRSWVKWLNKNI